MKYLLLPLRKKKFDVNSTPTSELYCTTIQLRRQPILLLCHLQRKPIAFSHSSVLVTYLRTHFNRKMLLDVTRPIHRIMVCKKKKAKSKNPCFPVMTFVHHYTILSILSGDQTGPQFKQTIKGFLTKT